MAAIHLAAIVACWERMADVTVVLAWVYTVGVITSILNHGFHKPGTTWEVVRLADRGWMVAGVCTDAWCLFILMQRAQMPTWVAPVGLGIISLYIITFALAKLYVAMSGKQGAGNIPHLITHASATVLHVMLLLFSTI